MDASGYAPYMPAMGPPRMYWCPVLNGPTRRELDAGIDLTDAIAHWQQADDHFTLEVYQSDAREVRELFPRGTAGHLVLLPVGDLPGARMDTWPVSADAHRVDASADPLSPSLEITLRITGRPRRRVLIPQHVPVTARGRPPDDLRVD
jgi:hypothetical protein